MSESPGNYKSYNLAYFQAATSNHTLHNAATHVQNALFLECLFHKHLSRLY